MKLFNKLNTPSRFYLLVNIFVSAIGFVRSFAFMKWMDMNELGIISLIQTAIMFLGLFQFGLINGGYRIFALDKSDEQRNINNLLFSYFALISGCVLLGWLVVVTTNITLALSNSMLIVALMCGILTLIMNWLTNTLIGKRLIKDINKINLISATSSLAVLPSIMIWGISGAIISLIAQPLIFISISLLYHKELRPTYWNFDLKLAKHILKYGFIPFLAGIFTLINLQIERWSIAEILGTEELGKFYLIFIYSALFTLIPASLLNIFFPQAIYAYENCKKEEFIKILKKHLFSLLAYLILVSITTIIALQFFIDLLLPNHSQNTKYIFLYLPGLFAIVLGDPLAIIFNATVHLKPLLIAGLLSVILTCGFLLAIYQLDIFTLKSIAILKSSIGIITFVYYSVYIAFKYKSMIKKCS